MWVIVLRKWGYSMPDDVDGGVVEYNWIFFNHLTPNTVTVKDGIEGQGEGFCVDSATPITLWFWLGL